MCLRFIGKVSLVSSFAAEARMFEKTTLDEKVRHHMLAFLASSISLSLAL